MCEFQTEELQSMTGITSPGDDFEQTPTCAPLASVSQFDGPQRTLENGTQEAFSTLVQAIQDAQQSAFVQVRAQARAQVSQLTRENDRLREQLSGSTADDRHIVRTASRAAKPWFDADVAEEPELIDRPKPARPTRPAGKCAVLDHIEAFTLPTMLEAFTEPPQPLPQSRNAWSSAGCCGETGLPGQLQADADKLVIDGRHGVRFDETVTLQDKATRVRQSVRVRASTQSTAGAAIAKSMANTRRRMFPDKTELMDKVQQTLVTPEYRVADMYHKSGQAQMLARHPAFESATLGVIVLNSIWIAIDTDHNTNILEPPLGFVVVENLFCGFFFLELLVRLLAFERKRDCVKDYWFVFDALLVTIAVLETWVMVLVEALSGVTAASLTGSGSSILRLLRMARLARTARMARLLRAVPEVMIMFKGIVVASHAVICTIFVLGVMFYVFALFFRQLTMDTSLGEAHFRSVPSSMGTLLLRGTVPDFGDFVYDLSSVHILLGTVGVFFVLLTTLLVLNMLAGVLVNVVLLVAEIEKEESDAIFVSDALGAILDFGDDNNDKSISKQEFEKLLLNPEAVHLLKQVNVDVVGLVELSDFIFIDSGEGLNCDDLFKLLLSLRGSNTATVKDLVEMRKFIAQEIGSLESYIGGLLTPIMSQLGGQSNGDLL